MKKEDWYFNRDIAVKQISVGIPMGLQYSITAIGTMMVQSSLNILGSYAVAAFTAGSKIENIFTQAFVAIGTAMSTYNAQNIGARKLERVRKGFRAADVIGGVYAVLAGFILFYGKVLFLSVYIGQCGYSHSYGGNLSAMCGHVYDSSLCGQFLPQRIPGNGLWTSANAFRCGRAGRKRHHGNHSCQ